MSVKANIAVGAGGFFGTYNIADNLLEGQPNPIDLNCGLVTGTLGSNYFEANTGMIRFITSRWQSAHTIMPQYVHSCPEMYGDIKGGYVYLHDHNIVWRLSSTQVRAMARPVLGVAPSATPAVIGNAFHSSIPLNATPPSSYFVEPRTVGELRDTPFGVLQMRSQTGTANPLINSRISVGPGMALCAVTPMRAKTAVATPFGASFFDGASALLIENPALGVLPPGEWWAVHTVLSGLTTTTTPKLRWTSAADIELGPTTFYAVPVALATATAAQKAQNAVPVWVAPAPSSATTRPVRSRMTGITGVLATGYGRWDATTRPGSYQRTPTGQRFFYALASGTTNYLTFGLTQTAAQIIPVSFYARVASGGTANLTLTTLNQAGGNLAAAVAVAVSGSEPTLYTALMGVDVGSEANATTAARLRFSTDAAVEISDVAAYLYDPATLVGMPPAYALRTDDLVIPGKILAGQTSVEIPHNLPHGAAFATATAGGNATVWVSALDATKITVTAAAAAPGSDLPVFVRVSG